MRCSALIRSLYSPERAEMKSAVRSTLETRRLHDDMDFCTVLRPPARRAAPSSALTKNQSFILTGEKNETAETKTSRT